MILKFNVIFRYIKDTIKMSIFLSNRYLFSLTLFSKFCIAFSIKKPFFNFCETSRTFFNRFSYLDKLIFDRTSSNSVKLSTAIPKLFSSINFDKAAFRQITTGIPELSYNDAL